MLWIGLGERRDILWTQGYRRTWPYILGDRFLQINFRMWWSVASSIVPLRYCTNIFQQSMQNESRIEDNAKNRTPNLFLLFAFRAVVHKSNQPKDSKRIWDETRGRGGRCSMNIKTKMLNNQWSDKKAICRIIQEIIPAYYFCRPNLAILSPVCKNKFLYVNGPRALGPVGLEYC